MKMTSLKERRRKKRKIINPCPAQHHLRIRPDQYEIKGEILDISPLGVKFVSYKPFANDSLIPIGFSLLNFGSFIKTVGRVVRSERINWEEHHVALEFDENVSSPSLLEEYIDVMERWKDKNAVSGVLAVLHH